jgi:hypothetical protein
MDDDFITFFINTFSLGLSISFSAAKFYGPGRPVINQVQPIFGQTLGILWATMGYLGLPWATLGLYLGLVPWATLDVLGCTWASLYILGCPWVTLGVFRQTALPPWANHPACPWPLAPTSCYFYSVIYEQFFLVLLFGCLSRIVVC